MGSPVSKYVSTSAWWQNRKELKALPGKSAYYSGRCVRTGIFPSGLKAAWIYLISGVEDASSALDFSCLRLCLPWPSLSAGLDAFWYSLQLSCVMWLDWSSSSLGSAAFWAPGISLSILELCSWLSACYSGFLVIHSTLRSLSGN